MAPVTSVVYLGNIQRNVHRNPRVVYNVYVCVFNYFSSKVEKVNLMNLASRH